MQTHTLNSMIMAFFCLSNGSSPHHTSFLNKTLPWKQWVEEFVKGYEDAAQMGERIGLDVFFGYEAGYDGTDIILPSIFCPNARISSQPCRELK